MILFAAVADLEGGPVAVRLAQTSFGWKCLRAGRSRRPVRPLWCSDPREAVADYLALEDWPPLRAVAPLPLRGGPNVTQPVDPSVRPGDRKQPPGSSDAAARLRRLMTEDPRSRTDLAALAGMTRPQWSQIQSGRRAAPTLDTAERILRALGKPLTIGPAEKPTIVPAELDPDRSPQPRKRR